MSEEEINYWLEVFSEDRFAFQSKDGKVISFYKTFENMKELQQENKQLKEKVDMYENPEDLTLMFMYCDEKAKDKIKHLTSVLKEIRECIEKSLINVGRNEDCFEYYLETTDIEKLLEIIDKGIGEDK